MKKRSKSASFLGFFTVLLCFFLTGCLGQTEINDFSIISGAALDYSTETGEYTVTAEVATRFPDAPEGEPELQIIKGKGKTFQEAVQQMQDQKGKQTYWSHAQVLLFSQNAASAFESTLDYLIFESDMRLSVDLIVLDLPQASDFWNLKPGSTGIHAFDLEEMLASAKNRTLVPRMKAFQAYEILNGQNQPLLLPCLSAEENTPVFSSPIQYQDGAFHVVKSRSAPNSEKGNK